MAKIQKYDIAYDFTGANLSIFPHIQGDYIKVSELREWIEENEFYFLGIKTLTSKMLLAAIDTEGK